MLLVANKLSSYPFLRLFLPLSLGICLGDWLYGEWGGEMLVIQLVALSLSFIATVVLYFRKKSTPYPWHFGLALSFTFLLVGAFSVGLRHRNLDFSFDSELRIYKAQIHSYPQQKPKTYCFSATILPEKQNVLLYLSKDCDCRNLKPGDVVEFSSHLSKPQKNPSETDFDYPLWLYRRGVVAQGYSRKIRLLPDEYAPTISDYFAQWRQSLLSIYSDYGLTGSVGAVLSALTLADKSLLDSSLKQTYSQSGASHILALSGLHLAILYGFLNILLFATPNRLRWRKLMQVPILVAIWLFTLLVGCPVSLLRASIMCTMCSFSIIAEAPPVSLNNLSLAGFIILLVNPFQLFDVGFQLSFAAVFSILLFYPSLYSILKSHSRLIRWCWSVGCVSFVAQVGVAPLVAHYFGQLPLYFLPTNFFVMVIVPLILALAMAFLVVPIPFFRTLVVYPLAFLVDLQNGILGFISALPCSSVAIVCDWYDVFASYLMLVSFSLAIHQKVARRLIIILASVLIALIIHLLGRIFA